MYNLVIYHEDPDDDKHDDDDYKHTLLDAVSFQSFITTIDKLYECNLYKLSQLSVKCPMPLEFKVPHMWDTLYRFQKKEIKF